MILVDVNILVYAFRKDAPGHARMRSWLHSAINSMESYGISDFVLAGFLRVVSHPKVFDPPSPLEDALAFAHAIRARPNCVPVMPGVGHWEIFTRLVRGSGAKGNLIADAYLAALAIEHGCEWITTDRDYSRFHGLRWRHPLSADAQG